MSASGGGKQNAAHARHVMQCGNAASHENEACWRHQACRGEVAGDCRRTLSDDRRWKSGDVKLNGDSLRAASSRRRHYEPYWLIRAAHPRKCRCAPLEFDCTVVARGVVSTAVLGRPPCVACGAHRGSVAEAGNGRINVRLTPDFDVEVFAWAAAQSLRFGSSAFVENACAADSFARLRLAPFNEPDLRLRVA